MTTTKTYEEKQKEEKETLDRRRKRLAIVAAGIVERNGFFEFKVKDLADNYEAAIDLVAPDGRVIHLTASRYEKLDRLRVTGRFPHDAKGRYVEVRDRPEITIGLDRSIDAIHKEIARRFLTVYQEKFDHVIAQIQTQNERHKKLLWVGKRLAERLDARFDPDRVDGDVHLTEYRPERISVRTYDGERFSLDVELTSEAQLNQILDILQPRKP